MKRILIPIILLLISHTLFAQEVWTLKKCIDYAMENNVTMKNQALNTESSAKGLDMAKAAMLPNLNGYYNHNLNNGKALNSETYSYVNQSFYDGGMGISSRMDLFKGMYNYTNVQKSKDLMQAAEYTQQKAQNDLMMQIVELYLQILYNQELLEVSGAQLLIIENQIEQAQKLVKAGVRTKDELLKLQYQHSSEKVAQTQIKNDLKNNKLSLVQLMDLPEQDAASFEIEKPADMMLSPATIQSADSLYAVSVTLMPELKAQQYRISGYEKDITLARSAMYPSLNLAYQYYTRYNELGVDLTNPGGSYPISNQLEDNLYGQLTFGVEIPIFNRFAVRTNRQLAEIQKQKAEYDLQNMKKNLYSEIHTAYNNMTAAYERYRMQEDALKYAQESFRFAQQQIDAGVISALDFTIQKNTLIKAESELLQAKYQYVFSMKLLDFYMGNPVVN